MNALILNKTKQRVMTADEATLCCVTYIDVEDLIYAATSVQALPTSNIKLYFTADIDHLRRAYNPEYRVDAVVAGDHISHKLLTYLKYACSKDALTPYIIYEPTDNIDDWRIIKPVQTDKAGAFISNISGMHASDIHMHIETALSMIKALTGMDTSAAIQAMQAKAEASNLDTIEANTSITA